MTPELMSSTASIFLSLGMSYIPGLSAWYQSLATGMRSLVMALLLVAIAAGATALACAGIGVDLGVQITCDKNGFIVMMKALVAALVANQATYVLSPQKRLG